MLYEHLFAEQRRSKMNHEGRSCGVSWVMASFLLGGIVGAAVAVLTAPKAGKETRQQIRGLADDAKEKAGAYYGQVKEKVASAVEDGKAFVDEKRHRIADVVHGT
jgi:gas vesicle protein